MNKKETALFRNGFGEGKKCVYIALIAIFALSIFLRYYGFHQPHGLTFDEGLYSGALAKQLQQDPTDYSTQRAYEVIKSTGRYTPEYLNRPLFKHPPLYCYLIAVFYKIFGQSDLVAVSVSIWLGSLMVLTVFFLGKVLYDDRVGLLAAGLLCLDPVHWICSERIWMETTLSFFMLLAVLFFALGQKQKFYLPLSGLSIGFAMATKYPGILSLFIIVTFVILIDRSLMKQKGFWLLCFLPFLALSPWIVWNWRVYGNFTDAIISVHGLGGIVSRFLQEILRHKGPISILLVLAGLFYFMRNKISQFWGMAQTDKTVPKRKKAGWIIWFLALVLALIFLPFLRGMVKEAFVWKDSILVGWSNPFASGPWYFYLTRLAELSPFYLFAYLSVFLIFGKNKGDWLLLLSALWILGAFILLGNYQSRYILPAVPFLILLSARWQVWAFDKLSSNSEADTQGSNPAAYRVFFKLALIGIGLYFIAQTLKVDSLIAIGPDHGYF